MGPTSAPTQPPTLAPTLPTFSPTGVPTLPTMAPTGSPTPNCTNSNFNCTRNGTWATNSTLDRPRTQGRALQERLRSTVGNTESHSRGDVSKAELDSAGGESTEDETRPGDDSSKASSSSAGRQSMEGSTDGGEARQEMAQQIVLRMNHLYKMAPRGLVAISQR